MKFLDRFLNEYQNTKVKITDEVTGVEYSLMDTICNVIRRLDEHEQRISSLESESIETSNVIYELHNKIDMN